MISVIIPTYNRKKLLPRALDSVLKQTVQDFEILVVDDASTDGTEAMLKERYADARIRYERLPSNQGVHAARNGGLDLARGEYVVFLDSDDELLPHALERGQKALEGTAFGIVGAPFRLPDGQLTGYEREEGELPFVDQLCGRGVRGRKNGFGMLRRSLIGDTRWKVQYLQSIFFRKVASKTRTWYIAEPLGLYHFDKEDKASVTTTRNIPNPALSITRARVLVEFLDEFGAQLLANCPSMYGFYAYGASVGLLLGGEVRSARKFAHGALRAQPRPWYLFFYLYSLVPFSSSLLWFLFSVKGALRKVR